MPSWSAPLIGPGLVVDLSRPIDVSMPIVFARNDGAPRAFGLPPPRSSAVEVGAFIGDVRRGGSCNCETHTLTPHGDGTHTEGVGHLLHERVSVLDLVDVGLMPALLVSVEPVRLDGVEDDVVGNHASDDLVIDELSLMEAIERAMRGAPANVKPRALLVRTGPGEHRRARAVSVTNPAYFTVDAAAWVCGRGYQHLLVDLPSLDRRDDGGLLGAHRAFFDVPARAVRIHGPPPRRTITELVAVDALIADGMYALLLQLAPIIADAVPSRPLLFPLVSTSSTWLRS